MTGQMMQRNSEPCYMMPKPEIREILRLFHAENYGTRQIGEKFDISSRRIHEYIARAHAAGISWPLPEGWGERELQSAIQHEDGPAPARKEVSRPAPDFAALHQRQQAEPALTLHDLYAEYRRQNPHGYCYSRFCSSFRQWRHDRQWNQ